MSQTDTEKSKIMPIGAPKKMGASQREIFPNLHPDLSVYTPCKPTFGFFPMLDPMGDLFQFTSVTPYWQSFLD